MDFRILTELLQILDAYSELKIYDAPIDLILLNPALIAVLRQSLVHCFVGCFYISPVFSLNTLIRICMSRGQQIKTTQMNSFIYCLSV